MILGLGVKYTGYDTPSYCRAWTYCTRYSGDFVLVLPHGKRSVAQSPSKLYPVYHGWIRITCPRLAQFLLRSLLYTLFFKFGIEKENIRSTCTVYKIK